MDRRVFVRRCLMAAAVAPLLPQALHAEEQNAASNQERLDGLREQRLQRIAFGSCNDQTKDQSYWTWIARENPQLWIWLGDNIYANKTSIKNRQGWYQTVKENPYYAKFRSAVPVIGTWDDHDYWNENADGSYAEKDASKEIMLDFLDVGADHPVRRHPGVFQSYTFGPSGQRTRVILLDLRYFQDRQKSHKMLLGELQWQFLAQEILESPAELLVIGSSLNVSSPIAGGALEGWQAFPEEKTRLYELLAATDKPAVLLSGDRHMGELYRIVLGNGKPVYEIMSSGLTHAVGVKLPSKERQGEMVGRKNFGVLEIDWTETGPQVQMNLRSAERPELYQTLQTHFAYT